MTCVAIIPARGGSRRIPGKNIKVFHGKPIIAYSIEVAKESGLFDFIYVSTDSQEIANVARDHEVNVIQRTPAMAQNSVGTLEVMRSEMKSLTNGWKADCEYACCIYATAPLMDVADLKRGYNYLTNMSAEHAISVGYPPLQDAAQFYWSTVDALQRGIEYFDTSTVLIPIKTERVCDINTPHDWDRAEKMYKTLRLDIPVFLKEKK